MKRLFLSLAATLFAASTAVATPVRNQFTGLDQDHKDLITAMERAGVTTRTDTELCKLGMEGYYSTDLEVGICVRGRGWEENQLNTIRHEATHVIQDCLGDGQANWEFTGRTTIYEDPHEFARDVAGYTDRMIYQIYMWYSDLSYEEILLEVEAFAVADAVDAKTIADALDRYCAPAYN